MGLPVADLAQLDRCKIGEPARINGMIEEARGIEGHAKLRRDGRECRKIRKRACADVRIDRPGHTPDNGMSRMPKETPAFVPCLEDQNPITP